ncbi:MAG: efflux RND transporter periplasmic adaptor subunit [Cyanophyceae cyanobacterium]
MSSEKPTSAKNSLKAHLLNNFDRSAAAVDHQPRQNGSNSSSTPRGASEPTNCPNGEKPSITAKSPEKTPWKNYWWLVPVLGVVVAIGGVTVMRLQENASEVETTAPAPLSVQTATAQQEPIRAWVSSEGTVQAAEYQHLTFEVEGDITYLADRNGRRLREGDLVREGELLAKVDDRELIADLQQAQAALAEARQQRAAAQAQVAQAQAQLTRLRSARDLAETQLERYQFLYEEGAVAAAELDTRRNTLQEAGANRQAAQAEVAAAQEQLQATQAQIDTARARVTQAEVALEGARIYAPFDGVIAYLNYTEGEYFSPQIVTSQLAGDYQGILERIPMVIIDPSLYEVIVDLAGPTGESVDAGQAAFVAPETAIAQSSMDNTESDLTAAARATGAVFAVNPAISPGGRAIEARIRLNPATTENVRHGEQVLTWIAVEEDPSAVVVPLNAVVYRDQVPYVFVVEEDTVEQREVELGIRSITNQQIVSGVQAGEAVVTQGQNRLVDGAPVQIVSRSDQ